MTFRAINGAVVYGTTVLDESVAEGLRATYMDEYRAAVLAYDTAGAMAALDLHGALATAIMDARAHQRADEVRHALRR